MHDVEGHPRRLDALAALQQTQVLRFGEVDPEPVDDLPGLFGVWAPQGEQLAVRSVQPSRDAEVVGDVGGRGHVVDVTVGEEDSLHLQAVPGHDPLDGLQGTDAGVDDDGTSVVEREHVAVGLPGAGGEGCQEHAGHPIEWRGRAPDAGFRARWSP